MKNERAVIMALTFCIGFTTGLIAYGIPEPTEPVVYTPVLARQAAVATSQLQDTSVIEDSSATSQDSITSTNYEINDEGLYHIAAGERTLISPTIAFAGAIPEAHRAVHGVAVSPDNQFVFFCAETPDSDGACYPRVYVAATFSIHPVFVNDEKIVLETDNIDVSWTSDNRLLLDTLASVSAERPWYLR